MQQFKALRVIAAALCWTMALCINAWAAQDDPEKPKILAGYADGEFFIKSEDGNYKLVPIFTLQLQHRAQFVDGDWRTHDFFLRRIRFGLKGNFFTRDLEYHLQFEMGTPRIAGAPILDPTFVYFDYQAMPLLHVRVGQFKVPFSMQDVTPIQRLLLIERSLANNEFAPSFDIGVMFWGATEGDLLQYFAGVFNGDGRNKFNANKDMLLAARLAITPLGKYKLEESDLEGTAAPRITFGLQGFRNKDSTASDNMLVLGGFVGFKYSGFSLQAEYYNRTNFDDRSIRPEDLDAHGYYAQVGYFVLPQQFEIAMRSSQVLRTGRGGTNDHEITPGLNYYFKGQTAKLQLGYALRTTKPTQGTLQTQFQLAF